MHRNSEVKVQATHSADHTARKNLQPCVIFIKSKMSVYVADIFATLLNHATKFKQVEIREKVSPVLVSNGRREK